MSRRSATFVALLALTLVAGLVSRLYLHRNSSIHSARAELAEVLGPRRLLEGRLTGGFAYAPYDPSHPAKPLSKDRRIALRKISREISGSSPQAIADRALLRLIDGSPRPAVEGLERAVAALPTSAALLSDLSAVYLADARVNGDAYSSVKALEAAENALSIDPGLAEAHFNRALALEHLFLRNQARSAWQDYPHRDPKSGWAHEGQARGHALEGPDAASRWALQVQKLEAAVVKNDSATVRQIVDRNPQAAREYAEEKLFGDWAKAELAKRSDDAKRILNTARAIGDALVVSNGERMVAATVETIDRADAARDSRRSRFLTAGHVDYQDGLAAYAEGRFASARELFAHARTSLRVADSSFAGWAEFRLAVSEMQLVHYDKALDLLGKLKGDDDSKSLAGRALWVEGLILAIRGRYLESVARYREALEKFATAREEENLGVVRSLIAECLAAMGDLHEAWRFHGDALSLAGQCRNPVRRQQILEEASSTALQAENPAATLDFLQEALGVASPPPTPAALYCLRRKALAYSQLQQLREAKYVLNEAKSILPKLLDETVRQSLSGDLLAAEGRVLARQDPIVAIEQLTRAIKIYRGTDYSAQLALLYGERGRAYRAVGNMDLAGIDFQQAIGAIQSQRRTVSDAALRASYLAEFRSIFDDMVDLQTQLGHTDAALDFAETSRAQVFRELLAGTHGEKVRSILTAQELQKSLPESAAIVEYHILPRKLLIWVLRRTTLELFQVEVASENLGTMIEQFRQEIINQAPRLRQNANARRLHELLVGKIRSAVRGAEELVFVPDQEISSVPFAALPDGASGRYLVEDFALSLAPSANIYSETLERGRHQSVPASVRAMIIGDPAFDRSLLRTLPRLPQAEREAREIAAIYPRSSLIFGPTATKKNFLEAMGQFGIIHFAGHAVSNPASPSSSFLALAPAHGDSGILYARELYQPEKLTARLVVLSACGALAGESLGVEGVENLAKPFLVAGVPEVVASLWAVDDRLTRAFFGTFYRRLLVGSSVSGALRQAQLGSLRGSDRSAAAPASWAGFQVVGTSNPVIK